MKNSKLNEIKSLIGNTPMIEITYQYQYKIQKAYFKLEWYNVTGSIKDRMAIHILTRAYEQKQLEKGQSIIETSSGNTGISLSAIGSYLGHSVTIFMPEHMSEERKALIKNYGANLELIKKEDGFLKCLEKAKELAKSEKAYLPSQFENESNVEAHYNTTGMEILHQLETIGKTPTALVAGVGTGGTLMGISKRLKERNPQCKVYAIEPKSSPTLKVGYKTGSHKIQGISDDFIPSILKLNELSGIIDIADDDAISMAQKLSKKLGLGVGISSGANFLGAVVLNQNLPKNNVIISVFPDDNKKYLSMFVKEDKQEDETELTSQIRLLNYKFVA